MTRDGPPDPEAETERYLVRLAPEIATKARQTRKRFQRRLVRNLEDAVRTVDPSGRVEGRWSRIYVTSSPDAEERLARVFGVSSLSRIDATVEADLDVIVARGLELYREAVAGARTFAVDARRTGQHPFSSQDVRVRLGAALNAFAEVDLDEPEVTVSVEVRDDEAHLFRGRTEAEGGLPLGVEGSAVCLLSGGFDSAAAAWLMLKRGVELDYVFCNLAGAAYERSVASVAKVLADDWSYGYEPRMHVVDFGDVVDDLRASVTPRFWQVVLKRLMYRAAERIARDVKGDALVTGESLGQVSSQTLRNLRAIDDAAGLPVFRPLLGYDKNEIIRLAERIGTSALSARVHEYCAILPDRPVTSASPRSTRYEEAELDADLLEAAVRARRVLDLRTLEAADLVEPYVFIDHVPENARVIDCRPPHQFAAWHLRGAARASPDEMARRIAKMDKGVPYVLYCDVGVQTAPLAELMQRLGYEAYSFRGGVRALRRWVAREDNGS